MNQVDHADAVRFLKATHDTLARQTDLSPDNGQVNACLGRLVAMLKGWHAAGFGHDLAEYPELSEVAQELPGFCARAEYEMEKWWCRRILASDCPGAQALAAFWYLDEYEALCRGELMLLGAGAGERFAFLGSGALPLTAILLARSRPHSCVTCVDCDESACELAERLIALLGFRRRIDVTCGDAEDYYPAKGEVLICASLLEAPGLFEKLRERQAERLIVRDAEGAYRFCYRPARLPRDGFIERIKSPPSAERINTSRYFEADRCEL
ncbi:MAG: nicotianamine synthase family protein [Rhodomicrobiaceae bacterium]